MRVTGLKDITRQQLIDKIKVVVTPAYVDLKNNFAVIRFTNREDAMRFQGNQTLST